MNYLNDLASFAESNDLPAWLTKRLQQPLPGTSSQRPFAASLCYGRHRGPALPTTRAAAVMILLTATPDGWVIPMTRRPAAMMQHAGQVCFPGGAMESGEDVEATALREIAEELGIQSLTRQHVIGRLTPLWVFASDFWVTPILACCQGPLAYRANPDEVAEVIEVPLARLAEKELVQQRAIRTGPLELTAPAICLEDQVIWGASCMILGELMSLLKEMPARAN